MNPKKSVLRLVLVALLCGGWYAHTRADDDYPYYVQCQTDNGFWEADGFYYDSCEDLNSIQTDCMYECAYCYGLGGGFGAGMVECNDWVGGEVVCRCGAPM